jgi:hypothetical protein
VSLFGSMVDGRSDQTAFDGLRGVGGNGSRLQGHRLRRWTVLPPSWSPRPSDVEIRLTLYRAVIFAGNAYPALTQTHLAKRLFLQT